MKNKDWFTVTGESTHISLSMLDFALEGLDQHIKSKKLASMAIPYMIEAGLAISLEPSLLYAFT
jgi:hypothetical protein